MGVAAGLAGRRLPQPQLAVLAPRRQRLAVPAERHGTDNARVRGERADPPHKPLMISPREVPVGYGEGLFVVQDRLPSQGITLGQSLHLHERRMLEPELGDPRLVLRFVLVLLGELRLLIR